MEKIYHVNISYIFLVDQMEIDIMSIYLYFGQPDGDRYHVLIDIKLKLDISVSVSGQPECRYTSAN